MLQIDRLEIEIVTVQGVDLAPQATTSGGHHHERSHSRTIAANPNRSKPKERKKSFFGSFGRKSRPQHLSSNYNIGNSVY